MVDCCKYGIMTDQYMIADKNATLILKMTAGVHKYIFPEVKIPSEIGINVNFRYCGLKAEK